MNQFFYSLIRFVPDLERMEPINVGIILQGQGKLDFALDFEATEEKDVGATDFRRWRSFLEEEVRGEAVPFLQPPKQSRAFLDHLSSLCTQTVLISKPLLLVERLDQPFEAVLQRLFRQLVVRSNQEETSQSDQAVAEFEEPRKAKSSRGRKSSFADAAVVTSLKSKDKSTRSAILSKDAKVPNPSVEKSPSEPAVAQQHSKAARPRRGSHGPKRSNHSLPK